MGKFTIDFFELSFLAEACIPPRPIARTSFWHDLIDKHYHLMLPDERKNLFDWITKNPLFNKENEDCQLFYARFNPDNQYVVDMIYNKKKETHRCFRFNDHYYTSRNTYVIEEYIVNVKKHK